MTHLEFVIMSDSNAVTLNTFFIDQGGFEVGLFWLPLTCELIAKCNLSQSLLMLYSLEGVLFITNKIKSVSLTHIQIILSPHFKMDIFNVTNIFSFVILGPTFYLKHGLPYAH